ncbi:hypothetical protein [Streptomyces sp. NPDC055692]|uniref:hypothetical protein n=1 Tax=Streptomyces sp. NPDC055692 TaxID=3155683 RepID=UPI003421DEE4
MALDSAQQAGRAWDILIAAGTEVYPDQDVLTEATRRTGISARAVVQDQGSVGSV